MLSLILGLCAALAWGVHDICVRYVSQRGGILPALATVLVMGTFVLVPVTLMFGGWQDMTGAAYGFSALSGLCYVFGCIGLYQAFAIGPVRLVAPIMAARSCFAGFCFGFGAGCCFGGSGFFTGAGCGFSSGCGSAGVEPSSRSTTGSTASTPLPLKQR